MRRKWGSCSTRGRLTFDTGLLAQTWEKRAEAVLHELLHLKYPSHGRMFRALLTAYLEGVRDEQDNEARRTR